MVAGRSAAMGINRILDSEIDALNPRTKMREIPQGVISLPSASLFVLFCAVIFISAAFQLNMVCGILSFPVLALFIVYPLTKRFTWTTHLCLGLCLGLAPLGVWIAISGQLQGPIILLGLGVLFWVSGFDIIYACQDFNFDSTQNLFSIPKRFGIARALRIALFFHGISLGLLIWVGISFHLNFLYFIGCCIIAAIMLYEHNLISPNNLSKVQAAFNANGWISVTYLVSTWLGQR
jgi:4-hydroxybenzoate polyprenyltransferase